MKCKKRQRKLNDNKGKDDKKMIRVRILKLKNK